MQPSTENKPKATAKSTLEILSNQLSLFGENLEYGNSIKNESLKLEAEDEHIL